MLQYLQSIAVLGIINTQLLVLPFVVITWVSKLISCRNIAFLFMSPPDERMASLRFADQVRQKSVHIIPVKSYGGDGRFLVLTIHDCTLKHPIP